VPKHRSESAGRWPMFHVKLWPELCGTWFRRAALAAGQARARWRVAVPPVKLRAGGRLRLMARLRLAMLACRGELAAGGTGGQTGPVLAMPGLMSGQAGARRTW
jgi:hypothetical protein